MKKIIFLMTIPFGAAFAQPGILDQHYSGPFDLNDLCCESTGRTTYAVGQSFRPTQPILTAISVHLKNLVAAPKRVRLILRTGGINGAPIHLSGQDSATVAGNSHGWVDFDFCPVRVIPENTYTIQILQDDGSGSVLWSLRALGDPYSRGVAYRSNLVVPWDYGFRTYYRPEATSAQAAITGILAPANATAGAPFAVTISYALQIAPAGAFVPTFATASVGNLETAHSDACEVLAGNRSATLTLTLPNSFPLGQRPILVDVGVIGHNLARGAKAVNVQ